MVSEVTPVPWLRCHGSNAWGKTPALSPRCSPSPALPPFTPTFSSSHLTSRSFCPVASLSCCPSGSSEERRV